MKVGITIKDYYVDYLEKIANLNHLTKTAVCSLIVENFLSYNKRQKKFPLFMKAVRIVYDEKTIGSDIDSDRDLHSPSSVDQDSEYASLSFDEVVESLEASNPVDEFVDPDGLPF